MNQLLFHQFSIPYIKVNQIWFSGLPFIELTTVSDASVNARLFLPRWHRDKAGADTHSPSLFQSAAFNLVLQICQSPTLPCKAAVFAKYGPACTWGTPMESFD